MWPFKKKDELNIEALMLQIESLPIGEAKILFVNMCDDLGEKISLVANRDEFVPEYELDSTLVEFFSEYTSFSPNYMDLDISIESIGLSEAAKGHTRIGYDMGWSEVNCEISGEVFSVYLEDSDGISFVKSDRALTIWHYMVQRLSVVYPEVLEKNITRLAT